MTPATSVYFPHPVFDCDLDDVTKAHLRLLTEHFDVIVDGKCYRAPKGMLTDGASIPPLAWRVIGSPFTGRYYRGAVIHDAGYKNQLLWGDSFDNLVPCTLSRAEVDELFWKLMIARKVGPKRAWSMHRAVRIGGWKAWDEGHKDVA